MIESYRTCWKVPHCRLLFLCGMWFTCCLLGSSVANADQWQTVPEKDAVAVLNMLAGHIKANREHVSTWRGNGELHDILLTHKVVERASGSQGPVELRVRCSASFKADLENMRFTAKLEEKSRTVRNTNTGAVVESEELAPEIHSVVTPEHTLRFHRTMTFSRFHDLPTIDDRTSRVVFREVRETADKRALTDMPNPCLFFSTRSDTYDTVLSQIAEDVGSPPEGYDLMSRLVVERSADESETKFRIRFMFPGHTKFVPLQIYVLSSRSGYNVEKFEQYWVERNDIRVATLPDSSSSISLRLEWEFKNLPNGYVPIRHEHRSYKKDGSTKFVRTINLATLEAGFKLDSESFTYAELGLKDGDRLKDMIGKRMRVLVNREWVDVDLPQIPFQGQNARTGMGRNLLVLVNVAFLLVVIVFVIVRRAGKRREHQGDQPN